MASTTTKTATTRVRVWDLPVHIFQWCLAIGVIMSRVTGLEGSTTSMEIHVLAGPINRVLIAFRLAWGYSSNSEDDYSDLYWS